MDRQRTRSTRSLRSVRHMPVIKEQHDSSDTEAPALPEKSPLRYTGLEVAALHENIYQYPPPAYSRNTPPSSASADTPKHEVATRSRKPTWITTRGGWWRLAFIALVTTACVLALVLGLALGLRHNNHSSSASASGDEATYPLQFPAGSYAFDTALVNISTSCTSNANTFRCYPFTTYSASGLGAAATFSWIITQTASAPTAQYNISSQSNPFVPQFRNISMTVVDGDTDLERLTFSFPLDLAITPAAAIDTSNSVATCWFNSTIMSATIYTKRRAELPTNITSSVSRTNPSDKFDVWPFAVEVEQTANAGDGVPTCVNSEGGLLENFALPGGQGSCGCVYSNFGL